MTCAPGPPTFRLLDALVGWDPRDVYRLTGFDDETGVRLALQEPDTPDARRYALLGWFGHRCLAPGCGRCAWYLLSADGRLLRRDSCTGHWVPAWLADCDPQWLTRPLTVAARGHLLAVAEVGRVLLWRAEGQQFVVEIPVRARALAFTPRGELLVARTGSPDLLVLRPVRRGPWPDRHRDQGHHRAGDHRPRLHDLAAHQGSAGVDGRPRQR